MAIFRLPARSQHCPASPWELGVAADRREAGAPPLHVACGSSGCCMCDINVFARLLLSFLPCISITGCVLDVSSAVRQRSSKRRRRCSKDGGGEVVVRVSLLMLA